MPLKRDPNQTVWLSLAGDADIPEATRPAFAIRAITTREQLAIAELVERRDAVSVSDAAGLRKRSEIQTEAIMLGLKGWKNMPGGVEFSREAIDDVLQMAEKDELIGLILFGTGPTPEDKKKSDTPSPSVTS